MWLDTNGFMRLGLIFTLVCTINARRVRIQTAEEDDDYYSPEPRDSGRNVVLVSTADDYNGVYGQPASSRNVQDNYIPASRGSPSRASSFKDSRQSTETKAPPVQTIRNYNKVNDDGSFTFGYEAADGSFKEETRGTDCVVRGKYGYVDPDGNKREFTYVSGNPCDPNAAKEEESRERQEEDSSEPENIPANYPQRPIRPVKPISTAAPLPPKPVSVYQNQYEDDEIEQPEPEQVLRTRPVPVQPQRHRLALARPAYVPEEQPTYVQQRQRVYPSTTPATVSYHHHEEPRQLTITPRPLTVTPTAARAQPPATTYRPQLLQVAVTPRPALVYSTKQITSQRPAQYESSTPASVSHSRGPGAAALDFASEFQRFQHDNQIASTSRPVVRPTKTPVAQSNAVYSSELVYDPASGQYNTALYQTLPQTEGDFTLNHQIQPYVHQPQAQLLNVRQLQQQSPLYHRATTPRTSQVAYQQQQTDLQFQNSQQLFAQQQQARAQQQQQHQQPQQQHRQPQRVQQEPQQFYYVQPQAIQNLASGQIDAFLRGHNIQF